MKNRHMTFSDPMSPIFLEAHYLVGLNKLRPYTSFGNRVGTNPYNSMDMVHNWLQLFMSKTPLELFFYRSTSYVLIL